jgi:hypothetical protein
MEFIQQLVDDRNGKSILHRECIQRPVVNTEPPWPILFLDEEDGGRERRVTATYNPLRDHSGTLPLQLVLVSRRVSIQSHRHWGRIGLEDDVVVSRTRRRQPLGLGKNVVEGSQEPVQERGVGRGGMGVRPGRGRNAMPADGAPLPLEHHRPGRQVPDDQS